MLGPRKLSFEHISHFCKILKKHIGENPRKLFHTTHTSRVEDQENETNKTPTTALPKLGSQDTTHHGFFFIFRALRPYDQDSPISVWKPIYLFRAFVIGRWWARKLGRFNSRFILYLKGKHTSLGRKTLKNTWPFMRLIEVNLKSKSQSLRRTSKNSIIGERSWALLRCPNIQEHPTTVSS